MNKTIKYSCQGQSFSERNFQGALLLEKETKDKTLGNSRSFSERNFQGALLLEKETII